MVKFIAFAASLAPLFLIAAGDVQAGIFRHHRTNQPAAQQQAAAPAATASQGSNYAPRAANVWPGYPNYGNPVGSAYSAAAGLRPGQFFGTFGLRPADARARGAY
jgi:ABC-type transporter Mla subunit MlaD